MIKRTIEISREPCSLVIEHGQLLIIGRGETPQTIPARNRIPCEDVGVLVVDEHSTTYTHSVLTRLIEHGAAIVICGRDHMPAGLLLPLSAHTEQLWRLEAQLAMKKPLGKRLWTQIVAAKIRAQAANLGQATAARSKLLNIARRVRSGDAGGAEAHAARVYWSALFDGLPLPNGRFRRVPSDPGAPRPNNLLDYGYAVVRAAVARALISSGLLPALGIQHGNRANAFALADDLMEPVRPMVDGKVYLLATGGQFDLERSTKAELLGVLSVPVETRGAVGPLQVALPRYTASLVRCLEGETDELDIPKPAGALPEAAERIAGLDDMDSEDVP